MKTCPCNVHPLTTPFYIVKLGFTGVYIIFLFLLQNIACRYSLERTHNLCFEQKYEKSQKISTKNCRFYGREKSLYIVWTCFRNGKQQINHIHVHVHGATLGRYLKCNCTLMRPLVWFGFCLTSC